MRFSGTFIFFKCRIVGIVGMKNILLLIYILAAGISGYSQEKSTAELKMNYEFFSTGKTNKLHFTCLIPKNIDHAQNVIKTEFMPQPVKVFNENGNNYAEFIIDSFSEKKEISVNVTIEIFKSDFNTIKMNQTILSKFSPSENYLINERFIEKDNDLIKSAANRLIGKDTINTIKNIYNFTLNELSYSGYNGSNNGDGALKALMTKRGDCTDFSDLFVSLCRANNIPARVVVGYTTEFTNTHKHSWVEVYTKNDNWIRLDPTPGNSISFGDLKNKYIQLSEIRNDTRLNNYTFSKYKCWGDPIKIKETISIIKIPTPTIVL